MACVPRRWLVVLVVVVVVVGVVVAVRLLTDSNASRNEAEQLTADLARRTGGRAGEDAHELAQALIEEGVPMSDAVNIVALGDDVLADPRTAWVLARFEQNAPADAFPSRDLVMAARDLEVGGDRLWAFLDLVTQEGIDRQLPPEVLASGLREHGLEYATSCELVEQRPCPVDVAVLLTLDRQQADYEQWGHVDCRSDNNIAHPGCLTFADCADEYAAALAAQDADFGASETARSLGHEPGSASWDEWTAATNEAALSSREAHDTCVSERYGDGLDAYKALVLEG